MTDSWPGGKVRTTMNHDNASMTTVPSTGQRSADRQSGAKAWLTRVPKRWRIGCVIGLLFIMAVLQITSMRQEVQTIDEGVHLSSGVSYWVTGDFKLNEEHPPLIKLLAALPVVLTHPKVPLDAQSWKDGNEWAFAQDLLYHSGNNADLLLFLGRLPMVLVSLLLGLVLYLWGRKIAGDWGGLLTLGWFCFDPNFLAHSRYVTTDVGVTLAFAATLYVLVRLLEHWNWKRLLTFAIVFGFAQVTKFSAIFLLPVSVLAAFIWIGWFAPNRSVRLAVKKAATVLGIAIAGSAVAIFITYFGQIKQGKNDPWIQALFNERTRIVTEHLVSNQPPIVQRFIHLSDTSTTLGRAVNGLVQDAPIPAWSYFKGLAMVANHDFWGHLAYLNGQYSNFGWWWYFPEAFAIKTPLATCIVFVLGLVSLGVYLRRKSITINPALWLALTASLGYFLWSMTGHIDLGVRYVFPAYLGVFTLIGFFLSNALAQPRVWFRMVIITIAGLYVTTSLLAYPTYLSYFSEVVGGEANGPTYLVDSNIDWGQDLKRLTTYLSAHQIPYVCMSYFGQADLVYYKLDFHYLPTVNDPHTPADVNCVVAISVTSLLSQDGVYWWLKPYQPDARIGGSIYVYDFRNGRTPLLKR